MKKIKIKRTFTATIEMDLLVDENEELENVVANEEFSMNDLILSNPSCEVVSIESADDFESTLNIARDLVNHYYMDDYLELDAAIRVVYHPSVVDRDRISVSYVSSVCWDCNYEEISVELENEQSITLDEFSPYAQYQICKCIVNELK